MMEAHGKKAGQSLLMSTDRAVSLTDRTLNSLAHLHVQARQASVAPKAGREASSLKVKHPLQLV